MNEGKNLRKFAFTRSVLSGLSYSDISDKIYDISNDCSSVSWSLHDEEVLLSAFDDSEDYVYAFKESFDLLSSAAERMTEALSEWDSYDDDFGETFDLFLTGISDGTGIRVLGFDTEEEDYYTITSFESHLSRKACYERVMKKFKKDDILHTANRIFRILSGYFDLERRYEYLQAAIDIIKGQTDNALKEVRTLEKAYEDAEHAEWDSYSEECKAYERAVKAFNEYDKVWVI